VKIALTNAFMPSEQPSGVPYQVHHLANALVARRHDVTVFSFSPRPADARYALHQFPRPPLPRRFYPFAMAYRLARTDFSAFDVINAHGDNYLLRSTRPVVRTFHGTAQDELRYAKTLRRRLYFLLLVPLERLGAMLADDVIGVSETTRAHMPRVRRVIPCGVDVDALEPGAKTGRPTLLFVGTEGGRKRGAWLARTFRTDVLPRVPDAELRMVSDSTATEPGIRRYGRVDAATLAGLYRSAWAFCLPSTYEGFGVPYVEAMAARTAVVATASNPGAREVLGDGAYGLLVDDAALGPALAQVLSDAALRTELANRGLARSRSFAWASVAEQYENAYAQAIAARRARRGSHDG
jgi:glycosyltransferase involved in cell wall biosynthesis